MNLDRIRANCTQIGASLASTGSRTALSLNAAYVNGTSGPAVAVRYMAQTTDTIDEFYIFLDTITGTRGNITMEAAIFNENAAATQTGSTGRDTSTATVMPAGDDMWIKFTFGTPYTPTVGEILWIVAYNTASAPTTDYPQILGATTAPEAGPGLGGGDFAARPHSTTNGFSSAGTARTKMPYVIKQGSNYFGNPFTQTNAAPYTSNQLERGIQFTPTEDVVVSSFANGSTSPNFALARILADATAPGGSALNEYDLDSDANETTNDLCQAKVFDAAVTLSGGTTYKLTVTFSSNTASPQAAQIEDYASYSAMFDTLRAEDVLRTPWSVIDNGAGGWTTNKALWPQLALGIRDFPAIAGGGSLLRPVGLGGGLV